MAGHKKPKSLKDKKPGLSFVQPASKIISIKNMMVFVVYATFFLQGQRS